MVTYIYDNTFEGFLTAIYESFYSKKRVINIFNSSNFQTDLLNEVITIETDFEKYKKVKNSIVAKIDPLTLTNIYKLFLSNYENKGILCFQYLKLAFKFGNDIHKHLYLDEVKTLDSICRRVSLEAHRFTGLVRFDLINNKFLYASIEPDNNILELLSPHFEKRFPNEYWIIHDTKRQIAAIYDTKSFEITDMDTKVYNELKSHKDDFQTLWKCYFKSTTITERLNLKLQKRHMPKRYWNKLTELK